MSKSRKRNKKSRSRKFRKNFRKKYTRKHRAGAQDKVKCSICEKNVDLKDTYVPRECLMKNHSAAHRICKKCWWDTNNGFALETSSHKCPGCLKGLPLTPVDNSLVDLTED